MGNALVDMIGVRVGRLTVVARAPNTLRKTARWLAKCDCGTDAIVEGISLRSGHTRSCGCLAVAVNAVIHTVHGERRRSSTTTEYRIWMGMQTRCYDKNSVAYARYGGRGVTVCDRWKDFPKFLADVGRRPPGTSLDRYPNGEGNYEPNNVRWATATQQSRNRAYVKLSVESVAVIKRCLLDGCKQTQLARRFCVSKHSIFLIKKGATWSDVAPEEASHG